MKFKETIGVVFFAILNIIIAYFITALLNIQDIILYQSLTATRYNITYEIIIWFLLSLTGAIIYEKIIKKDEAN
ncbi:MAG: hypothetical protein J6Y29_02150 [Clostridiales bacterium]|nr:hypothetical protein [Clostridiales bacterium]